MKFYLLIESIAHWKLSAIFVLIEKRKILRLPQVYILFLVQLRNELLIAFDHVRNSAHAVWLMLQHQRKQDIS